MKFKKVLLFSFLLYLLLNISVVKADGEIGSQSNPVIGDYENKFNLTESDMIGNSDDGYSYFIKYELTEPGYFYFAVDCPSAENLDVTGVFVILRNDNFDIVDFSWGILKSYDTYQPVSSSLKAGVYYVEIQITSGHTHNYTYKASLYNDDSLFGYVEYEYNNSPEEAFEVEIDKMYSSEITRYNYVDYYKAYLTAGKKTRVYIGHYDDLVKQDISLKACLSLSSCKQVGVTFDPTRSQYYYEFLPTISRDYYFIISDDDIEDESYYIEFYDFGVYQSGTINTTPLEDVEKLDANYKDTGMIPVYRMYNPINGEHLYTTDAHEVSVIYQNHGWGYEGIGWFTADVGTPVYRLYNAGLANHLYTSDLNEINVLTSEFGWVLDNDGQPVMYSSDDDEWATPVYRVYNESLRGLHHLTTDEDEYEALPEYGWDQEGVSMYADLPGSPTATDYYNVNF